MPDAELLGGGEAAALIHQYFLGLCVIIGALVGSFLNVVIWRVPRTLITVKGGEVFGGYVRDLVGEAPDRVVELDTGSEVKRIPEAEVESAQGMSVVHPGSHCPACGTPIRWYDNIPILGWLWLRGRARCCGAKISARYPGVELLTAFVGGLVYLRLAPTPLAVDLEAMLQWPLYFGFAATLIAISFIDFDLFIIPNSLSLPGTALGVLACGGLALAGIQGPTGWLESLIGAAVGFGAMWALAAIGSRLFRKQVEAQPEGFRAAMGGGDVKLMAMIGAWLGAWPALPFTIFAASAAAAVVGVSLRVATQGRLGRHIQFGPFLSAGALLYFLAGPQLIDAYLRFVLPPGPLP